MNESITNQYTVCLLFTPNLKEILLCTKDRTDYKGLLNGIGGECLPNETPFDCATREIKEETGLTDIPDLLWIGTLELPYDCKHGIRTNSPSKPGCTLYFYTGIVPDRTLLKDNKKEPHTFYMIPNALYVHRDRLAGNGDLEYFIPLAIRRLEQKRTNIMPKLIKEIYNNTSDAIWLHAESLRTNLVHTLLAYMTPDHIAKSIIVYDDRIFELTYNTEQMKHLGLYELIWSDVPTGNKPQILSVKTNMYENEGGRNILNNYEKMLEQKLETLK